MNAIIGLGRWLFAIPFIGYGINHFVITDILAGMAPGGAITIYITGFFLIAAAVSMLIGKMDKLAATLLGIMLLLFLIPHVQGLMAGDQSQLGEIFKNLALSGGAFMYAGAFAKDKSVIG